MSEARKIKARNISADIRARLTDFELMSKYNISYETLQDILRQLVEGKAIRAAELEERSAYFDDPINRKLTRASYRAYLRVPIPIQESGTQANGFITDLSEHGFRTRGISAKKDDEKHFLIRAGSVSKIENFKVKAVCKWVDKGKSGDLEAGFAFLDLSNEKTSSVRGLIQDLDFGNRNLMRPKTQSTDD